MPLASVDEWRARIGSSWCALGRPVKSRRPSYGEYRNGSPPPRGGKRVKLQDGSVSAVLMFILMVVAMLTLWSLILNGYSPICTSIVLCTSLDVVLMQCALCMSLLSSSVSQPVSNIILSVHRELKLGSGTKLEDFPYCTKFPIRSDLDLFTCAYFFFLGEEQIEAKVPVAGTVKRNLFRSMSNFWHKLVEKMKSIKQCLSSALVKFSLLLRCGDVEENPGPYDQEKDGPGGIHNRLSDRHLPILLQQLSKHAAKWREIGIHLGFLPGELANIEATPDLIQGAPLPFLGALLTEWTQWAPGDSRGSADFATLKDLKKALRDAGYGATAHDLYISGLDSTLKVNHALPPLGRS